MDGGTHKEQQFLVPPAAVERPPDEKKQVMEFINPYGLVYLSRLSTSLQDGIVNSYDLAGYLKKFHRNLPSELLTYRPKSKDQPKKRTEAETNRNRQLWETLYGEMCRLFDNKEVELSRPQRRKYDALTADDLLDDPESFSLDGDSRFLKVQAELETEDAAIEKALIEVTREFLLIIARRVATDNFLVEYQDILDKAKEKIGPLDSDLVKRIRAEWNRVAKKIADDVIIIGKKQAEDATIGKKENGGSKPDSLYAVLTNGLELAYGKTGNSNEIRFYPCFDEIKLGELLGVFVSEMAAKFEPAQN